MPTFDITSPEGKNYEVTVPNGVTANDVMAHFQNQMPKAPEAQTTAGRTMLDQGLQGATFGFGDEIANRGGAAIASLFTGEKYDDLLKEANQQSKERLQAEMNQRPVTSIASNIAGGVLTGGAGASTKAGTAVANSLRTGDLAARVGKGALAGAASGGLYGAGAANEGQRLSGAGEGAIGGAVIGGVIPAAGAAIGSLRNKAPQITSDAIKELATAAYQKAEQSGGILKPEITNKFIDEIQKLTPQSEVGKIVTGDTPFTQAVQRISQIKDKPISLQAAQEIDESIGDAIDGFFINGKLNKQGQKLLQIQNQFRDSIESAGEDAIIGGKEGFNALKEGRQLWSSSRKLSDIERIISRADMMDNPATGIKSGFRTLYNNPSRMRGFNDEEKALVKKAAESGVVSDTLRTFGSRLMPIIAGASGGGLGGTVAAQAASMASRGAATKLQLNKATKLANTVANNAVPNSTQLRLPSPAMSKAALMAQILQGQNSNRP